MRKWDEFKVLGITKKTKNKWALYLCVAQGTLDQLDLEGKPKEATYLDIHPWVSRGTPQPRQW